MPLPPDEFIWPNLQRLPFELEDAATFEVAAIIPDRSSPPDRPVDVYKIVLGDSTIAGSHIQVVYIRSDHPALDVSDIVLQIRTLESEEDAERALRFPSTTAAPPASLASPNHAALAFGQGSGQVRSGILLGQSLGPRESQGSLCCLRAPSLEI